MLHPYVALVWGMGASLVLFFAAYLTRAATKNHKRLAIMGVVFNLASSIYLIYSVRFLGLAMPARLGVEIQIAHRLFATAMAVVMILMLVTGLKRMRARHISLHKVFLLGYTLTYVSGLVIFHG